MERDMEEQLFIFHTSFTQKEILWSPQLVSLFSKGSKPHFLTVMHYAGGRKRETLLFPQVLVMPMSICWTE